MIVAGAGSGKTKVLTTRIAHLMAKGVDLEDYTVVGNKVVFANFEGNFRGDGTQERKQPWWDQGYTIDLFYLTAFLRIGYCMSRFGSFVCHNCFYRKLIASIIS